jgi:hypothetical protein
MCKKHIFYSNVPFWQLLDNPKFGMRYPFITRGKNIPDIPTYNPGCGGMEEPSLSVITLRCKCTCVLGSEC